MRLQEDWANDAIFHGRVEECLFGRSVIFLTSWCDRTLDISFGAGSEPSTRIYVHMSLVDDDGIVKRMATSGKRKGPTRNRTGVARMSYITEVMSIRTGSDNRYTIEPKFEAEYRYSMRSGQVCLIISPFLWVSLIQTKCSGASIVYLQI